MFVRCDKDAAIDGETVRWAYKLFLMREPFDEDEIEYHLKHTKTLSALRNIFLSSVEFYVNAPQLRLARILELMRSVEHYQPLYGLERDSAFTPKRKCADRLRLLLDNGLVDSFHGCRVLDIGASLGYFSLNLAARGAVVTGIDLNPRNAEIATLLAQENETPADFHTGAFDPDFVRNIKPFEYDVALCLSVMHHVIYACGVEATKRMVAALLEKIPVVFFELANCREDKSLYWVDSLPADELEIFGAIPDVSIRKLGEANTHLGEESRNLYLVYKNSVAVIEERYPVEHVKFASFSKTTAQGKRLVVSGDSFIKEIYPGRNEPSPEDFVSRHLENAYKVKLLSDSVGSPRLVAFDVDGQRATYVLERVEEVILYERFRHGLDVDRINAIVGAVVEKLAILWLNGYYHNDIRLWNVIYSRDDCVQLIDFDLASTVEAEDHLVALQWFCYDLLSGDRTVHAYPIEPFPESADVESLNAQPLLEMLFSAADWTSFIKKYCLLRLRPVAALLP